MRDRIQLDINHANGELMVGTDQWRRAWLPILGPSSICLALEVCDRIKHGESFADTDALAASIGLGHHGGRHSPLAKTMTRMDQFAVASFDGEGVFSLRAQWGQAPPRRPRRNHS